jgi:hypothetical protein
MKQREPVSEGRREPDGLDVVDSTMLMNQGTAIRDGLLL